MTGSSSVEHGGDLPPASTSAPDESCEETAIAVAAGDRETGRLSDAVATGLADRGVDTFALYEDELRRGRSAAACR